MAVPQKIKVPVPFDFVFPHGLMLLGVEPAIDFDVKASGALDFQARDENGRRLWQVKGFDLDPEASKFGRIPAVTIKMAADQQPVPPAPQAPGFNPLIAFEGLMITPWRDDSKCKPPEPNRKHRCGARQAYSMFATAMVDPADLVDDRS